MSLIKYFPNLPTDDTFYKMDPLKTYDFPKEEELTPEMVEILVTYFNKYVLIEPTAEDILTFVEEEVKSQSISKRNPLFDAQIAVGQYYGILISAELQRLGFPTASIYRRSLVVASTKELNDNYANTALIACYLNPILADFPYKDDFHFEHVFPEMVLTTTGDHQKLVELIKYLSAYIDANEEVKNEYDKIAKKFIRFHEEEAFDSPIVFILCAQLSAILAGTGIKSTQSNLELDKKNIGFEIVFDTGDDDYDLMLGVSEFVKKFNQLQTECFGSQVFKINFGTSGFTIDLIIEKNLNLKKFYSFLLKKKGKIVDLYYTGKILAPKIDAMLLAKLKSRLPANILRLKTKSTVESKSKQILVEELSPKPTIKTKAVVQTSKGKKLAKSPIKPVIIK